MSDPHFLSTSRRLRKTPFTSRVMAQGVQAFAIYNHMLLPTVFESLEDDYWHLCSAVQVWDVSVQRQVSMKGADATRLVQWMTPRDISRDASDRCVYLPLADEHGKLINDPVGIRLSDDHWWLSIADSDVALWAKGLARGAGLDVVVDEADVWPLAVQGPLAEQLMALRAERDTGLARRLVGIAVAAPDGPRQLAEMPFVNANSASPLAGHVLPEAIQRQSDLSHCLGSQAWSPRYRHQLATAMLDEPLASATDTTVILADGSVTQARICSLPFDFESLGIASGSDSPLAAAQPALAD